MTFKGYAQMMRSVKHSSTSHGIAIPPRSHCYPWVPCTLAEQGQVLQYIRISHLGSHLEIGGLECAVYCSAIFFAAQLWAVKMADVGWQKLRVVVSQHRTYEGLLTNSRVNKGTMMF